MVTRRAMPPPCVDPGRGSGVIGKRGVLVGEGGGCTREGEPRNQHWTKREVVQDAGGRGGELTPAAVHSVSEGWPRIKSNKKGKPQGKRKVHAACARDGRPGGQSRGGRTAVFSVLPSMTQASPLVWSHFSQVDRMCARISFDGVDVSTCHKNKLITNA